MSRSLNRNLNRSLNRRLDRHYTRMLGGAHRPAPPNYLGDVCTAISLLIKSHKRLAKMAPHLFDFVEIDRRQRDAIIRPILDRVYGMTDQELSASATSASYGEGTGLPSKVFAAEGKETVNKR